MTQTGALSSYADLQRSKGFLTDTRLRVEGDRLAAARSIKIAPAEIGMQARLSGLSDQQLHLVANAIDRALCSGLSDRFTIVAEHDQADLSVKTTLTYVGETSVAASSASLAISAGASIAGAVTGVRIPTARLPVGLGALSVEAEAKAPNSRQVAAIVWSRGADIITSRPRISEDADAYQLGKEFAADFAKLLVNGEDPMRNPAPPLPTMRSVKEFFGGSAKQMACEKFGRDPGIADLLGGAVGLPPKLTDAGSPPESSSGPGKNSAGL